jgi:hypothetical protein
MTGDASDSTPYLGVLANLLANVRPFARGERRIPTRAAWDSVLNNPGKENEQYTPQKVRLFLRRLLSCGKAIMHCLEGDWKGFLGYYFGFKVIESGYFFTDK